jgi:uncharacterized protein
MKLIDNLLVVDLKNTDKEYLLVNSLNGLVDVVTQAEFHILSKWRGQENIVTQGEEENSLYSQLQSRKYIMVAATENEAKQKLLNKLMLKHSEAIKTPQCASFIFSYECNFSCPYCYEKGVAKSNNVFTKEMVNAVLDLYPNRKPQYIRFFGGEPLLLKNKSIIEYLIKQAPDSCYCVTTNGYYLKEFLEIFKTIDMKQVQVTLDGNCESHNKTRVLKNGGATYDIIISNIKLYIQNNIPIKIRMNVSRDNYQLCLDEKEKLAKLFGYSELLTFEIQGLFQDRDSEVFKGLLNDDGDPSVQKNRIWDTLSPILSFFRTGEPIRPRINACSSAEQNRYYDNNGDIYACILSVGCKEKTVGKFYPTLSYQENSILNRTILKIENCRNCSYSLICGGGCPNAVVGQDKDAFKQHCFNMKYSIDYLIPYLYNKKYDKVSLP